MKKLLLIFLFSNYLAQAQYAISDRLQKAIDQIEHIDQHISIRIELLDKVDALNLHKTFIENETSIHQRAVTTVETLKFKAESSQENILSFIKEYNSENYDELRSYWIINHIYLEATSNLIYELAQREDIALVDLNADYTDTLEPFKQNENTSKSDISAAEIGIDAINARALWEMGYTGKGLLVYDYDTGVWPDHPAYSNRYIANRFPESQAWYGHFRDFANGIVSDHGTHTLGTMIGEGLASGDTVGIAPKSYWMACDLVTSTVEELPTVEEIVGAYQWALDADNNTQTTHDIPDVINNSWRWRDNPDTVHCHDYIVDLMNALEAAGIASVFSGGNAGPNNTSISAPQRINTTIVNTFSVGSINANSEYMPISSFSSRGPLQCPANDSSLVIHPEVVAPGQEVRSAWGQNTYNTISGTSMAAPHVSGAVLLLKEAFPFLSGADILTALYYTAIDMGEPGEDNTFGMGLIDCLAAFNYLSESYNPVSPSETTNDLELKLFNEPNSNTVCSNSIHPNFRVHNHSTNNLDSISIKVLLNQTEIDNFMWYGTIPVQSYADISLDEISIDEIDSITHELQVIVSTDNWEEVDIYNNSLIQRFSWHGTANTPLIENFESANFSTNNWIVNNSDDDKTWEIHELEGLNGSNYSARMRLFFYDYLGLKDQLLSQSLHINSEENYQLHFDYAHNHRNIGQGIDSLIVEYSTDCGSSYHTVFEKGGDDLETSSAWDNDFEPQDSTQWNSVVIHLDAELLNSNSILLRFTSVNGKQNNLYLDNIILAQEDEIQLIELESSAFNLFPNPTNGILNITCKKLSSQNIEIDVLDIRGAVLYSLSEQVSNNLNKSIDLSSFKPGTYFVRIKGKELIQTKRFIIK